MFLFSDNKEPTQSSKETIYFLESEFKVEDIRKVEGELVFSEHQLSSRDCISYSMYAISLNFHKHPAGKV